MEDLFSLDNILKCEGKVVISLKEILLELR